MEHKSQEKDESHLSRLGSETMRSRPLHSSSGIAPMRGDNSSSLLAGYIQTVSRFRWGIACFAAIGMLLGILIHVSTLPVYEARTSVDIQSLNGDFMNLKSAAPMSDQTSNTGDMYVQTQIKLLQSQTLLDDTAARLEAEPHPALVQRSDLLSRARRALHLGHTSEMPFSDIVAFAEENVKVKPLGLTRLIEINCDSWSADFSAKFCNELTRTFQEEDQQSRALEAQKTSQWLARQAEDVRLKAEQSQKALEAAVGGNGLILSQGTETVGEDHLRDIQQELVKAQADRMEKEAQAAVASSSSPDSVPGIADRATYQSYQLKLAELNSELAKLVPGFTEDYPKVIAVRAQIKEVQNQLAREQRSDANRISNDFEASRHREELLRATYNATAANVSENLKDAARVRLLRSEVDSEEQLYQTLIQRAKEAGFASAMHASTLHVVDAARTPPIPVEPRRGSSAVFGLMLGLLAGVGLAFYKDRHSGVLRLPGETSRYLDLHELGVIPSSTTGNSQMASMKQKLPWAANLGGAGTERGALALAGWDGEYSLVAEAYRSATLSILFTEAASKKTRMYVVASPNSGDGKTSVTCNLGVALSKSKLRVLLIDGDLRRPTLHSAMGVPNKFGLRDILSDEGSLKNTPESELFLKSKMPNLWVLPSGSGEEQVLDLLHSANLRMLFECANRMFDVVLIDTPPMLHMADARLFADAADGVILVVRSGVTMREDAVSALDKFERDGVRVIGTILNDFDPAKQGQSGYYSSYYAYKNQYQEVAPR